MAVNIDCLVRLRLNFLKGMITEALRTGKRVTGKTEVDTPHMGRLDLTFKFSPETMSLLILLVNGEDERISQNVRIVEEDSNLRNGSKVYYFLSYGYKSRTLYSDGKGFYPRAAFKHSYSIQRKSHKERAIAYREEPFRKYGKETYRGRLTPYGKRLQRYRDYEDRLSIRLLSFISQYG